MARSGFKKGLRESGRGGGSSKGDTELWRKDDTTRFRKGLFEEKLSDRPEDRSPMQERKPTR